jgi:hypothetical protein
LKSGICRWCHAGAIGNVDGMPNYRRVRVQGGTYVFTVNLLERRRTLLVDHVDALRESFRVDYVHINPQKHGHVVRVADWPHSSFHRYVRTERLPADWAGECRKAG